MRPLIISTFLGLIVISWSCGNHEESSKVDIQISDTTDISELDTLNIEQYLTENVPDSTYEPSPTYGYPLIESKVEDVAMYLLNRLNEKNWHAVSALTSRDFPLKISPKVHLDSNTFTLDGNLLAKLELSGEEIIWYSNTASGEPMEMNFAEYANQFIFDNDYTTAEFHVDEYISRSSLINNIKEEFPNCKTVEAFIQNEGEMNWQSLNMVFKYIDNKYYLVALIHDQYEI